MNKEQIVNDALVGLVDYVKTTKDFVAEQSPLAIQEIIKFGLLENAISGSLLLAAGIVLPIAIFILTKYLYRKIEEEGVFMFNAFSLFSLMLIFGAYGKLSLAFKAYIAPRVYVIEYLAELIKK